MWVSVLAAYFDLLRTAAASAAELGKEEVAESYDGGSESTTVASHVRHRPFCHGANAIGAFFVISKYPRWFFGGRNITAFEGLPNRIVNLMMASKSPSTPLTRQAVNTRALTNAPQGKVCASQRLRPRRKPTATWIVSSHMRRPQEKMGSAKSQSLLWAALIAKSLALSRSFIESFQIVVQSRVSQEHPMTVVERNTRRRGMDDC